MLKIFEKNLLVLNTINNSRMGGRLPELEVKFGTKKLRKIGYNW